MTVATNKNIEMIKGMIKDIESRSLEAYDEHFEKVKGKIILSERREEYDEAKKVVQLDKEYKKIKENNGKMLETVLSLRKDLFGDVQGQEKNVELANNTIKSIETSSKEEYDVTFKTIDGHLILAHEVDGYNKALSLHSALKDLKSFYNNQNNKKIINKYLSLEAQIEEDMKYLLIEKEDLENEEVKVNEDEGIKVEQIVINKEPEQTQEAVPVVTVEVAENESKENVEVDTQENIVAPIIEEENIVAPIIEEETPIIEDVEAAIDENVDVQANVVVSDINNIFDFYAELQKLNPNVDIRVANIAFDPLATERLFASVPVSELVLPEGFYYNEKNGITNKHNTASGAYITVDVEDLSLADERTLLPKPGEEVPVVEQPVVEESVLPGIAAVENEYSDSIPVVNIETAPEENLQKIEQGLNNFADEVQNDPQLGVLGSLPPMIDVAPVSEMSEQPAVEVAPVVENDVPEMVDVQPVVEEAEAPMIEVAPLEETQKLEMVEVEPIPTKKVVKKETYVWPNPMQQKIAPLEGDLHIEAKNKSAEYLVVATAINNYRLHLEDETDEQLEERFNQIKTAVDQAMDRLPLEENDQLFKKFKEIVELRTRKMANNINIPGSSTR